MDGPWNYDEMSHSEDVETRQRFMGRDEYVAIIMEKEKEGLAGGYGLSSTLQDSKRQYLAFAMRYRQREARVVFKSAEWILQRENRWRLSVSF